MDNNKPTKIAKIFDSDKPYRTPDNMILDLSMIYIQVARLIYDSKIEDWRSPFIVNATLAIELYLKSMLKTKKIYGSPFYLSELPRKIVHEKSEIDDTDKIHLLSKLFKQIPERNQEYILHVFSSQANSIDFIQFLEDHSRTFIQWRYCFEGNTETFSAKDVLNILKVLKGNKISLSMLDREIPHYEV
jgi:hypothetical protein